MVTENSSEFKNKQFNGRFEYSLNDSSSIISTIHHTNQPLANEAWRNYI